MKNTNLFYKSLMRNTVDLYHIGIKIDIFSVKNSQPRVGKKFSAVFTDFFLKGYLFSLTVFRMHLYLPLPTDVIDESFVRSRSQSNSTVSLTVQKRCSHFFQSSSRFRTSGIGRYG